MLAGKKELEIKGEDLTELDNLAGTSDLPILVTMSNHLEVEAVDGRRRQVFQKKFCVGDYSDGGVLISGEDLGRLVRLCQGFDRLFITVGKKSIEVKIGGGLIRIDSTLKLINPDIDILGKDVEANLIGFCDDYIRRFRHALIECVNCGRAVHVIINDDRRGLACKSVCGCGTEYLLEGVVSIKVMDLLDRIDLNNKLSGDNLELLQNTKVCVKKLDDNLLTIIKASPEISFHIIRWGAL